MEKRKNERQVKRMVRFPTPYYQDEYATIYNCDCREILGSLAATNCIITDPPYGVGFKYEHYEDNEENFAGIRAIIKGFQQFDSAAVFMSMKQLWTMPPPKWMLCWAKPGSCRRSSVGGFSEWEPVLLYGKWRVTNDLKILPDCVNHAKDAAVDHPCPKPINLMKWIVNLTDGVVVDPFAGSGTTLVAAKQLGRKSIGCEINKEYCDIIIQRLAQQVLPLA